MANGTCGGVPCNCPLQADECDGRVGTFLPGSAHGMCVTRQCLKVRVMQDDGIDHTEAAQRLYAEIRGEVKP